MNGKVKEFWETDEWKKFFTQPSGAPRPAYQTPGIDVGEIQEGALGPLRAEYERAVPAIGARLAKMGHGRGGKRFVEEGKLFRDFITQAGMITSDVALRGAQLQIDAAKLGLTSEQFQKQLDWEREKFGYELSTQERRWLREQALRETESEKKWNVEAEKLGISREQLQWEKDKFGRTLSFEERKFLREQDFSEWAVTQQVELEAAKFNWTKEEFQERLIWEKEQFNRILSSEDRRFDRQMELEWRRQELDETEIENKKQMFYDQLKSNENMFNREYTFKENQAMIEAEQEWTKIGLTEQQIQNELYKFEQEHKLEWERLGLTKEQIDNEMAKFRAENEQEWKRISLTEGQIEFEKRRFDKELAWQKEQFFTTFSFEETRWMDEFALAQEEAAHRKDIDWETVNNDMEKFRDALAQTKKIEDSRMALEDRLEAERRQLERELEEGRITRAEMEAALQQQQIDNEWKLENGWTDDDGVYHPGRLDLEQQRNDIMNMEIFGYFDEGYGPGSDNPIPPKYDDPPQFDELGNPIPTQEWTLYMDEHYHPGALDLKEWDIRIDGIFATQGISNVEPGAQWENVSTEDLQSQVDHLKNAAPAISQNPAIQEMIRQIEEEIARRAEAGSP